MFIVVCLLIEGNLKPFLRWRAFDSSPPRKNRTRIRTRTRTPPPVPPPNPNPGPELEPQSKFEPEPPPKKNLQPEAEPEKKKKKNLNLNPLNLWHSPPQKTNQTIFIHTMVTPRNCGRVMFWTLNTISLLWKFRELLQPIFVFFFPIFGVMFPHTWFLFISQNMSRYVRLPVFWITPNFSITVEWNN